MRLVLLAKSDLRSQWSFAWPLIIACSIAGCGGYANDPHARVSAYEGRLEAEVIREVGPPTRIRTLEGSTEAEACETGNRKLGVRELVYEIPSQGLEKRARDLMRLGPSRSTILCVDGAGRITRVVISEVH